MRFPLLRNFKSFSVKTCNLEQANSKVNQVFNITIQLIILRRLQLLTVTSDKRLLNDRGKLTVFVKLSASARSEIV